MSADQQYEIARNIVLEWWKTQSWIIPTQRLQNPLIDSVAASLRAAVSDRDAAIARAVAEEREKCCARICPYCRAGNKMSGLANGYHEVNDGLQARGDPFRLVKCAAAAIRARGERKE